MNNEPYVNPIISRPLYVDDSNYGVFTLQQLIETAKKENIPESEYCNCFVSARSDYEISFYYEREKTEQEIKDDRIEAQRKIDERQKKKVEAKERKIAEKAEKEKRKEEKAKLIASLTPEQRSLLGIK